MRRSPTCRWCRWYPRRVGGATHHRRGGALFRARAGARGPAGARTGDSGGTNRKGASDVTHDRNEGRHGPVVVLADLPAERGGTGGGGRTAAAGPDHHLHPGAADRGSDPHRRDRLHAHRQRGDAADRPGAAPAGDAGDDHDRPAAARPPHRGGGARRDRRPDPHLQHHARPAGGGTRRLQRPRPLRPGGRAAPDRPGAARRGGPDADRRPAGAEARRRPGAGAGPRRAAHRAGDHPGQPGRDPAHRPCGCGPVSWRSWGWSAP